MHPSQLIHLMRNLEVADASYNDKKPEKGFLREAESAPIKMLKVTIIKLLLNIC